MGVIWSDNGDPVNKEITDQELAKWWDQNPDEEALEATILAYIQARHSLPSDQVHFKLLNYSRLGRLTYLFLYGEKPDDWDER